MWKYKNKIIPENKSWVSEDGVTHPPNWQIWSAEEKAHFGLIEVKQEEKPDSKIYDFSVDDGVVTKKKKTLSNIKKNLINEVKNHQENLLRQTDWAIIRAADSGSAKSVPENIQKFRNAIRSTADDFENAISSAKTHDEITKLFVKNHQDKDGKISSTGILFNFPKLEEE
tara:strand:+ start:664 stop:1173 length:510 start_codon:yes stop_codon:yes gene_type:complete